MKSISYVLKYCEGCGTLRLRPVKAELPPCRICERSLARFGFRGKPFSEPRPDAMPIPAIAGRGQRSEVAGRMARRAS